MALAAGHTWGTAGTELRLAHWGLSGPIDVVVARLVAAANPSLDASYQMLANTAVLLSIQGVHWATIYL